MFGLAQGAVDTTIVVPFVARTAAPPMPRGWGQDEIAEAYRVIDLLARAGVAVHMVTGLSDEGDPWAAVMRDDNDEVVVHFARIDGRVILVSATSERVFSGPSLAAALRSVLEIQPLVLPRARDGVFLHPATLLAAFIATALLHLPRDATASQVDDAIQDEKLKAAADLLASAQQRAAEHAFSPMFLTAAVAAVAAALMLVPREADMDDHSLLLDLPWVRDQIHVSAASDDDGAQKALIETTAQDIWIALGHPISARQGEFAYWDATADQPNEIEHMLAGLQVITTEKLEPSAVVALAPAMDDSPLAAGQSMSVLEVAHAFSEPVLQEAALPSLSPPDTAAVDPLAGSPAQQGPSVLGSASPEFAEALGGFVLAGGENLYFEAATLLGIFNDEAAGTTPAANLRDNEGISNALAALAPIPVHTIAWETAADEKMSILKDFAVSDSHELAAPIDALAQLMAWLESRPAFRGVDRVVLFEADDVHTDIFMMYQGVAMVRGDLLQDESLQLALPDQIAFEMANGEAFRLLGVVDI